MSTFTADEMDAAVAAVLKHHPDLDGEALLAKARRVAAIVRHANDGPTWTAARIGRRG